MNRLIRAFSASALLYPCSYGRQLGGPGPPGGGGARRCRPVVGQLARIEAVTQKYDDGLVPGAVMLVARRGKVAWVAMHGQSRRAATIR